MHDSTAWKLAEYLAASQCIVAEPIRNVTPRPLQEGVHYLGFETPEDCVEACTALLDDPDRATRMREENHRYYREEVAPAAMVMNRLQEAMRSL